MTTPEQSLRDMLTRVEADRDEAIALLRRAERFVTRGLVIATLIDAFLFRFPQESTDEPR